MPEVIEHTMNISDYIVSLKRENDEHKILAMDLTGTAEERRMVVYSITEDEYMDTLNGKWGIPMSLLEEFNVSNELTLISYINLGDDLVFFGFSSSLTAMEIVMIDGEMIAAANESDTIFTIPEILDQVRSQPHTLH